MPHPHQPGTLAPDPTEADVSSAAVPTLPLMHAAFVLAGLGTMLLGPILPLLALRWHLTDSRLGLLLLAQFCGATLGGSTTSARLRSGLLLGFSCAGAGFLGFAAAPRLGWALAALLVAGFGVGRTIAAINILAGARYTRQRASQLSWLNFSWSFGALLSPLAAASLASRIPLPRLLTGFAACWLLVALALAVELRGAFREPAAVAGEAPSNSVAPPVFLYFALLLLLYGGLETCLSAWLTTYALRTGQSSLALSQSILVLLLGGLTAGRALAAWVLRFVRDTHLQRVSLLLAAGLTVALAAAHRPSLIAMLAILLGIALAPIFPATFAVFMARRPSARQAGVVLAASGIGAATLPALIGLISTRTGSLRIALAVPVAAALAMLAASLLAPRHQ